jgi:formate dehydrogenase iron-sulfur subunit
MNFGDRDKMTAFANKRLGEVKARYPKATLTGLDDLRVFYLLADEPEKYHRFADVNWIQEGMDRKIALKKIGRSLRDLSGEWRFLSRLAG